jgi:hypothetical protein
MSFFKVKGLIKAFAFAFSLNWVVYDNPNTPYR